MRPTDAEVAELGPDFTDRWNNFYKNKPDKPLFWLAALSG
jgi:alcohol oxidase